MSIAATTMPVDEAPTAEQVRDTVADAMRDAADSAAQHATAMKDAIADSGPVRLLSRFTYSTAYALSFGIVYTAVFVTQLLPKDNPVMHGFRDGADAARDSVKGG
jgi:hypothetical protein